MSTLYKTEPLAEGFVYGASPAVHSVNEILAEIAPTHFPVLIVGRSGTGKDAYARLLHRLSGRQGLPFHKVNCAAFDPAQISRHFSPSDDPCSPSLARGTLYLDAIQELDMGAQRFLGSLLPDDESIPSENGAAVRLICSTSLDLEPEVEAGRFRGELYFRLNGACLRLPALHDRSEDIPSLFEFFLEKNARLLGKPAPELTPDILASLASHRWPGNIRELENLARQMIIFGDPAMALKELDYSKEAKPSVKVTVQVTSLKVAARAAAVKAERELILQALERTHWNRKRAARDLQISYKSLLYKIKNMGISSEKHEC